MKMLVKSQLIYSPKVFEFLFCFLLIADGGRCAVIIKVSFHSFEYDKISLSLSLSLNKTYSCSRQGHRQIPSWSARSGRLEKVWPHHDISDLPRDGEKIRCRLLEKGNKNQID